MRKIQTIRIQMLYCTYTLTWLVHECLRADHILRVFDNVEMKETFVNEKEKLSGKQMDYRIPMYDITASYLKDLDFIS
jgi:hypothetical protein